MELIKVDPSELDGREAEVELLSQAEAIVCLPYGGVVVDDGLRTSDDSIFAIGEVACHKGKRL